MPKRRRTKERSDAGPTQAEEEEMFEGWTMLSEDFKPQYEESEAKDGLPWERKPVDDFDLNRVDTEGFHMVQVLPGSAVDVLRTDDGRVKLKAKSHVPERKASRKRTRDAILHGGVKDVAEDEVVALDVTRIATWRPHWLHPHLLARVHALGHTNPTPIQYASLVPAIQHGRDVVGAAETGSGKTLAFCIPIVHRLLMQRRKQQMPVYAGDVAQREARRVSAVAAALGLSYPDLAMLEDVPGVEGLEDKVSAAATSCPPVDPSSYDIYAMCAMGREGESEVEKGKKGKKGKKREVEKKSTRVAAVAWEYLPALVLAPTRELAKQTQVCLEFLCEGTHVRSVLLVGGLADVKQERLLSRRPDIVVATPGRLGDWIRRGHPYLSKLNTALQILVIDEVDRMLEKGAFEELQDLLENIHPTQQQQHQIGSEGGDEKREEKKIDAGSGGGGGGEGEEEAKDAIIVDGVLMKRYKGSRQTMLFSATLGVPFRKRKGAIGGGDKADTTTCRLLAALREHQADAWERMTKRQRRELGKIARSLGPVERLMLRAGVRRKAMLVRVAPRRDAVARALSSLPPKTLQSLLPPLARTLLGKAANTLSSIPTDDGNALLTGAAALVLPEDALHLLQDKAHEIRKSSKSKGSITGVEEKDVEDDESGESGEEDGEEEEEEEEEEAVGSLQVPAGLRLARVSVTREDRDVVLYYFLALFPGRTLIFLNSINTMTRLVALLRALRLPVRGLHGKMVQKQRMRALEHFKATDNGILVATDVAARGLDVPDVRYVVHYHLPTSPETFVHRSGRTARAQRDGLALALVEADDDRVATHIARALARPIPSFPIDRRYMSRVTSRVSLARKITTVEAAKSRVAAEHKSWIARTADEAGLDFGEVTDRRALKAKEQADAADPRKMKQLRRELDTVLKQPLVPRGTSLKYITTFNALDSAMDGARTEKEGLKTSAGGIHPLGALMTTAAKGVKAPPTPTKPLLAAIPAPSISTKKKRSLSIDGDSSDDEDDEDEEDEEDENDIDSDDMSDPLEWESDEEEGNGDDDASAPTSSSSSASASASTSTATIATTGRRPRSRGLVAPPLELLSTAIGPQHGGVFLGTDAIAELARNKIRK